MGPEAEGAILKSETADSSEAGFKGELAEGRFEWALYYFRVNFSNLVVANKEGGMAGLETACKERFRGVEAKGDYRFTQDFRVRATYAYHDGLHRSTGNPGGRQRCEFCRQSA